MRITYCESITSPIAFPKAVPALTDTAHTKAQHAFFASMRERLSELGVDDQDLMMRDMALVEPGFCADHPHSHRTAAHLWSTPADLAPQNILDHQADVMDAHLHPHVALRAPQPSDLQPFNSLAGPYATLKLLQEQRTADGVLAVWVAAALFTLYQGPVILSAKGRGASTVWNLVADAAHGATLSRACWSSQSKQALPDGAFVHQTSTQILSLEDRIAGLIAINARSFVALAVHPVEEAPAAWIHDAIMARVDARVAARAQAKIARLIPETPLQKAYRMLPRHQKHWVEPGARNWADLTAADARTLRTQGLSIAAMAVLYGTTEARMSKALRGFESLAA